MGDIWVVSENRGAPNSWPKIVARTQWNIKST